MNARSAVFALVSIKPQPLNSLVRRLPYAPPTVYNAVSQLEKEKLVKNAGGTVMIAEEYRVRKLSDIYIQCLMHGVDPEILTRDSTISVWKALENSSGVVSIAAVTGLSSLSVKKILRYLHEANLVLFRKRKPIVAEYNAGHPLHRLLSDFLAPDIPGQAMQYPGETPFTEILETPEQVEKILYRQIDESLTVRKTGFLVKGDSDKITIVESIPEKLGAEDIFLRKLFTAEGAEEYCILMVRQKVLDYSRLFRLAESRDVANVVGCYLDILRFIDDSLLSASTLAPFLEHGPKHRHVFLAGEKEHGKQGWEAPFEKRWNVVLYIDIGALRHGVGSL